MRRAVSVVTISLCALVLGFTLVVILVPALLGLQRYVITGGSMTGSIPKGAVIYSKLTPVEQLREGDVITFEPPGRSEPVTHRIMTIRRVKDGRLVFQTKGDFNESMDPWKMTLNEPIQARYVFHLPWVGYVLAALAVRELRMLFVGVPAILIALTLLWSIWRRPVGGRARGQDAEEAAPDDTRGLEGSAFLPRT